MRPQTSSEQTVSRQLARDTWLVVAVALVSRAVFVAWAWDRIGPVADGTYYDTIARRLAGGLGYTWLWPDGTVTPAAHYPVGYPALVALAYRVFGAHTGVAMIPSVLLGTLGAAAIHRTAVRHAGRRMALVSGLAFALHPALLSYTPALMTEGVTASLLALAICLGARACRAPLLHALLFGVVVGLATYVRPQNLVLAPLLPLAGFLGRGVREVGARRALMVAGLATAVALAVLAPWTARNCSSMGRCALVSVNGGWNLLIGTDQEAGGTWAPLKVPEPCREVWDEAAKDACFGEAARRKIADDPFGWLALAPEKLSVTFEYFGAGPWYLHASSPTAFDDDAKRAWGAAEIIFQRVLLAVALFASVRRLAPALLDAPGRLGRLLPLAVAAALAISGTIGTLALGLLVLGAAIHPRTRTSVPAEMCGAACVILCTAVIHGIFFGAGRYGLVVVPAVAVLAAGARPERPSGF